MLIRYLAQDDVAQAASATRLLERLSPEVPGYISLVVLAEVVWVMTARYAADRATVAKVVRGLLASASLRTQAAEAVALAVDDFERSKAEFSDALIARLARSAGCSRTVTFDRRAAQLSSVELLD